METLGSGQAEAVGRSGQAKANFFSNIMALRPRNMTTTPAGIVNRGK
jgi:hypothetical protein